MATDAPLLTAMASPPPSKRARTCSDPASKPYQPRTTTLLSLPDGPISLIFTFLKATDTGGIFRGPRHAFALAMTCNRLLRIFGTLLTRLVPDLEDDRKHSLIYPFTHNRSYIPTLTHRHMFHVIKLAGSSLREINLTGYTTPILLDLPEYCPRVERLSIEDCPDNWINAQGLTVIKEIELLPLRSLSIHTPSFKTLLMISELPQEFFLINVQPTNCMLLAFKRLLEIPPKTFHIHFCDKSRRNDDLRLKDDFRAYLSQICTEVQDFSLAYNDSQQDMPTLTDFLTLLSKPRRNEISKCRKMTLKGEVCEFLDYAHPEAHIEVTRCRQTFISCGDGIYPTRITLLDQYLTQDLSRLTEIFITDNVSTQWFEILYYLKLKRVRLEVQRATNLGYVPVEPDVVEVPSTFLIDAKWFDHVNPIEWLLGADEIRLLGDWSIGDSPTFFASLGRLLVLYTGKVVFLEHCPKLIFPLDHVILKALVMFLSDAVDKFEARGGDASTVRSLFYSMEFKVIEPH